MFDRLLGIFAAALSVYAVAYFAQLLGIGDPALVGAAFAGAIAGAARYEARKHKEPDNGR